MSEVQDMAWQFSVVCHLFHKTCLDLRTEMFAQFRKLMADGCSSFMLTFTGCKIGIVIKKDCNY